MNTQWNEATQILAVFDGRLDQLRSIVREFPADKLWRRPMPQVASLGNLIVHVGGSMRDWFENGLGQGSWQRDRDGEFELTGDCDGQQLIAQLDETRGHCQQFLAQVNADNWDDERRFRDKTWTVRTMLLRQLDHASYHAGQAAFLRRLVADLDPTP